MDVNQVEAMGEVVMSQEADGNESVSETYVVHGALIRCSCALGQPVRLVVPLCHGEYIHDIAQLNINDYRPMSNIRPFVACTSAQNPAVQAEMRTGGDKLKGGGLFGWLGEMVHSLFYKKKKTVEVDNEHTYAAICTPQVMIPWQNGKDSVLIDGAPALTSGSITSCVYGGRIDIVDDGQRK